MNSLKTIEIYNYKSIKHLELNLNRNLNIIVGSNNSGKSNIISAIFESLDVKNFDTALQSISRLENFERKLPKTILSTSNKQIITLNNKNRHSIEYEDNNTNTIYNESAKKSCK
ncbi:AAA family ATPase [Staphylococcus epidermidis]